MCVCGQFNYYILSHVCTVHNYYHPVCKLGFLHWCSCSCFVLFFFQAYSSKGQTDKAIPLLKKAIKLDPESKVQCVCVCVCLCTRVC